jgi:hypothetical protein
MNGHIRLHVTSRLPCRRCGWDLYLMVDAPHPDLPGRRILALCPMCDASKPEAQQLLDFFEHYGQAPAQMSVVLVRLVDEWIKTCPGIDEKAFEDDVRAWHAGEFD